MDFVITDTVVILCWARSFGLVQLLIEADSFPLLKQVELLVLYALVTTFVATKTFNILVFPVQVA